MNLFKINKNLKFIFIVVSLFIVGCSNGSGISVRVASGATAGSASLNQSNVGTPNSCSSSTQAAGRIFDSNFAQDPNKFDQAVHDFVSVTMDPKSLGYVSGDANSSSGIDFTGSFKFDSQGRLDTAATSMQMRIFDQYAGTVVGGQVVLPYTVQFSQASDGSINQANHQFVVRFSDSYGEITFQGKVEGQLVRGTVSYMNKASSYGSGSSQGSLGDFQIYTCGLIK